MSAPIKDKVLVPKFCRRLSSQSWQPTSTHFKAVTASHLPTHAHSKHIPGTLESTQSKPSRQSQRSQLTHLPVHRMLSRAAIRAQSASTLIARRGFHSSRAQLGSPYHYPEGPRSNIPFNPLTRFFAVRYWLFMSMFRRVVMVELKVV